MTMRYGLRAGSVLCKKQSYGDSETRGSVSFWTALIVCAVFMGGAAFPAYAAFSSTSCVIAGGAAWGIDRVQPVAVSATANKNIIAYQVTDGNGNWSGWNYISAGGSVSYTLYPQLYQVSGAVYGFQIQFLDAGYTVGSAYDTIYLDLDNPTISTPTDEGVYKAGSTVRFFWTASDGTSGIKDYYMIVGTQPGWNDKFAGWIGAQPGYYDISGCSDGVTYYCQMYAQDNAGRTSAWSGVSNGIKVDLHPPTVQAPYDNGLWDDGTVDFSFLGFDSSSGIAGYVYEVAANTSFNPVLATGTVSGNFYTYPDGISGVTYYCRVKAVDNVGRMSDWSSASDGVMVDLGPPTMTTPQPIAPYSTSDNITFSWTATDDNLVITDYYMQVGTAPGLADKLDGWIGPQPGYYNIPGCADGKTYYCRMMAKDKAGRVSEPTAWSSGITVDLTNPAPPGTPTAGTVWAPATVTFAWVPSWDLSGVAYYVVEIRNWPDWPAIGVSGTTTTNTYSFTGVNGNSYFCKVRAVDHAGRMSDFTDNSVGVVCDAAAPPAPGKPDGYVAGTAVGFMWNEVADDIIGSGLAGYNVQIWDDESHYLANGDIGNQPNWAVVGTPGRTYYCRVAAYDNVGNRSGYSPTSAGVYVPIPDTTPPTGSVEINGGADFTNLQNVALTLAASDENSGLSQVRLSNNGVNWATYAYAESRSWTLSVGDGPKTVYVKYGDNAGNWSSAYTDTITLDRKPPKGSFVINGGATHTGSMNVALTSSATDATSGVSLMRFSNDNANWVVFPYAASAAWALTPGDGMKTVFGQYADAAGNWSISTTASITVDGGAPQITLLGSAEVTVAKGGTYVDAGATALDAVEGDLTAKIVTVNPVDTAVAGDYSVTYAVADSAGNAAAPVSRLVHVVAYSGPVIDAPVTSLDFGYQLPDSGPTAPMTLQIKNIGDALLKLKGKLTVTGPAAADFVITKVAFTTAGVKPGASVYIEIVFDPRTTGPRNAVLTIPTNATNAPALAVPLSGNGLAPGEVTVSTNVMGHGAISVNPPAGPYVAGQTVTFLATPASGWTFGGWSDDLSGAANPVSVMLVGDTTATAMFLGGQESDFVVDQEGMGAVTLSPPDGPYYVGDTATLVATPEAGWRFVGWSGALTSANPSESVTLAAVTHIVATFEQIPRSLTTSVVGQGAIDADPQAPYYDGDMLLLMAVPATGWKFAGWAGDATGMENPVSITLTRDMSVTATFELDKALSNYQNDWMVQVTHGNFGYPWQEATPGQNIALHQKAQNFMNLCEQYNLRYGQIVDVLYSNYTRSNPTSYETVGDAATWTGVYLAALANKYAVTGDPSVLNKINATLDVFDMLTLCTKKQGYIARFAGPYNDPAYVTYYLNYTGNGYYQCEWPWLDRIYLGFSSRDTYVGTCFGLVSVWALVNDAGARYHAQLIIERVLDRLIDDGFDIKCPPPGNQTTYNAVSFGFKTMWMSAGLGVNNAKYDSKFTGLLNYGTMFQNAMAVGWNIKPLNGMDYFSNNLDCMAMYVISKTDPNASRRAQIASKFRAYGASAHFQPGFSAMYMAAANDKWNNVARGTLQGGLLDFQEGPKWMRYVDQSANPAYFPHINGDLSQYALLVRDRPLSDYQWQRSPGILKDGIDAAYEYASLDVFLPYWMGRQCGAIAAP